MTTHILLSLSNASDEYIKEYENMVAFYGEVNQ